MPLHRLSPSGPYLAAPEVANLAELAALQPISSDLVWVETLLCYWHLNTASSLAPDGITVIAAATAGNWERITSTTAPDWLAQAAWTIDPALGDDENAGDAATPLASFDELNRRLSTGAIQQDVTVAVASGSLIASADLEADLGAFNLVIEGGAPTVAAGTITTFTDRVHATPVGLQVTSADIADWTPYVGLRLRMTSGPQTGAYSWVAHSDPGGAGLDVARMGYFISTTGLSVTVAPGDTFVLEQFSGVTDITSLVLRLRGQNVASATRVRINSLHVGGYMVEALFFGNIQFQGCSFGVTGAGHAMSAARASRGTVTLLGSCILLGSEGVGIINAYLRGCLCKVNTVLRSTDGSIASNFTLWDECSFIPNAAFADFTDVQMFDSPDAGLLLRSPISIRTSTSATGGMSGNGNLYGMRFATLTGGGSYDQEVAYITLPNLLGTSADIRIDGSPNLDLTWAQVPFYGDEQKGTGTLLNGTATISARNSNTRGVLTAKATPLGAPQGVLTAPVASRSATQFIVNAADLATGALVAGDQSVFDWHIPAMARGVRIYSHTSIAAPT